MLKQIMGMEFNASVSEVKHLYTYIPSTVNSTVVDIQFQWLQRAAI